MEPVGEKTEITEEKQKSHLFQKGVSGNPNGRPKGSFSLVEMIKRKLQEVPEGKDKTYAEYFIEQLMKKSVVEGDVSLMKDMIDRVDGKARQNIGLDGGAEDKPIAILSNVVKNVSSNGSNQESNGTEQEA